VTAKSKERPTAGQRALVLAMTRKGLSRASVASKVGSSEAAVWYWCAGKRIPSAAFAACIEKSFGVKAALWGQSV